MIGNHLRPNGIITFNILLTTFFSNHFLYYFFERTTMHNKLFFHFWFFVFFFYNFFFIFFINNSLIFIYFFFLFGVCFVFYFFLRLILYCSKCERRLNSKNSENLVFHRYFLSFERKKEIRLKKCMFNWKRMIKQKKTTFWILRIHHISNQIKKNRWERKIRNKSFCKFQFFFFFHKLHLSIGIEIIWHCFSYHSFPLHLFNFLLFYFLIYFRGILKLFLTIFYFATITWSFQKDKTLLHIIY